MNYTSTVEMLSDESKTKRLRGFQSASELYRLTTPSGRQILVLTFGNRGVSLMAVRLSALSVGRSLLPRDIFS
jgi:hypothetical protein